MGCAMEDKGSHSCDLQRGDNERQGVSPAEDDVHVGARAVALL